MYFFMNIIMKEMAKKARERMASGFWQDESNRRKKTLAILEDKGADITEAKQFFVTSTKSQIGFEYNKEDEELYKKAKQVFLSNNNENALSVLIDPKTLEDLDENSKQRYIFNLSAKLQEFRERFDSEMKFDLQSISL